MPFYILILTNTYSNVKSDTLIILLSNLIILSDLLHHFHIKLYHFMIQYTTLLFFKILQNTSKYKSLRSYINLWKSIVRKSIICYIFQSLIQMLPSLYLLTVPVLSFYPPTITLTDFPVHPFPYQSPFQSHEY